MHEFTYHQPASLEDVQKLLANCEDPKIVAGGMTLLPTMKMRLAAPSDLIDISGVDAMSGIEMQGDAIRVGAMTLHAEVNGSSLVQSEIPALAALAGEIGDPQVRNRGTIGGSLSNSDPAADYPAAVLGLGATVKTDRREIAADDYFVAMFETAMEVDEVLVSVAFPKPKRAAYAKFPNPASRYAVAGVMVAETAGGVRVAVTGAGPCAFRLPEFEQALESDFSAAALEGLTVSSDNLNDDMHASADYRAHLVAVMARRAVQAAGG